MYKQAIDLTNDAAYGRLTSFLRMYPALESAVKTAAQSANALNTLPETAFAYPETRQFPIHTPEHAAVSYAYSKHAEVLPKYVESRIKTALEAYNINLAVFQPRLEKTAGVRRYLLPEELRFPVGSASDVKLAEQLIREKGNVLTDIQRTEAYSNLVKCAEEFGVALDGNAYKYAGQTLTDTEVLTDWLDARTEAALSKGNKIAAVEYNALAEAYRGTSKHTADHHTQMKLAHCISELDKSSGLTDHYGKALPNPVLTVWNTAKLAAEQVELNGVFFDRNMLASLPMSFWESALGADFTREFAPQGNVEPELLVQVLHTLPSDLKAVLVNQLSAYNR